MDQLDLDLPLTMLHPLILARDYQPWPLFEDRRPIVAWKAGSFTLKEVKEPKQKSKFRLSLLSLLLLTTQLRLC